MPNAQNEILHELLSFYGESPLYPSKAQWQQLLRSEQTGEVVMVNLLKLNLEGQDPYEEGTTRSGFELIERYQHYSMRAVEKVGGVPSFSALVLQAVVGAGDWDIVGTVQYPDIQAFISIFQDADYRKGHRYREAACADHRLLLTAAV